MTDDHNQNSPDSLGWLAFRYVHDELPAPSVEEFERRLELDQSAREALADAVALSEALSVACDGQSQAAPCITASSQAASSNSTRSAPALRPASRLPRRSRPLAWMALGAAASLAAVMLWQGSLPRPASDANTPSNVANNELGGKSPRASQSAAPSPAPAAGRDLAMVWLTSHIPSPENDPVAGELAWPALDEMANGPEDGAENGDNNSGLLTFDSSADAGSETPPVVNVPNWLLSAVAPARVEDN